jgi:hypothetical protein
MVADSELDDYYSDEDDETNIPEENKECRIRRRVTVQLARQSTRKEPVERTRHTTMVQTHWSDNLWT